jgi:hypothetical protein
MLRMLLHSLFVEVNYFWVEKRILPINDAVFEEVKVEPKTTPPQCLLARGLNISLTLKKTSTIAGNDGANSAFKPFLGLAVVWG